MASFTAIPLSDIHLFLSLHKYIIPPDPALAYQSAWNLIQSGKATVAPTSISDWLIAYNLAIQGVQIPPTSASSILLNTDESLLPLAQQLNLPDVNKERILRILDYLGVLQNDMSIFDVLPVEMVLEILSHLDCKTILSACNISDRFKQICKSGEILPLLRERVGQLMGLKVDKYEIERLAKLCNLGEPLGISAGLHHTLITKKGRVYSFGYDNNGQLGFGDYKYKDKNIPTLIPGLNNIIQAIAGSWHSLALTKNGLVYSFGRNQSGQLGLGDTNDRNFPILILGLKNIKQIATGSSHTLAVTKDGQVYAFGSNYYGELGLGHNNQRNTPTLIPGLNNIKQVTAGSQDSLALTEDGQIYSFGYNNYGQLGLGDINNRNVPNLIPGLNNIIQVSAGYVHTLALTKDGQVYSFGHNIVGQLGLGDNNDRNVPILIPGLNNVIQVSAGYQNSLALTEEGKVYSFGSILLRQLGLGDNNYRNIPRLIPGLNNIIQIATGGGSAFVISDEGKIYAFGNNHNGQLGVGDNKDRNIPTRIDLP